MPEKLLTGMYLVWEYMYNFFIAFFSCQVKPDTVVEVWKGDYQSELYNVTYLGYKALLASCWYLSNISFGNQWKKYYSCEPLDFNGKTRECALFVP